MPQVSHEAVSRHTHLLSWCLTCACACACAAPLMQPALPLAPTAGIVPNMHNKVHGAHVHPGGHAHAHVHFLPADLNGMLGHQPVFAKKHAFTPVEVPPPQLHQRCLLLRCMHIRCQHTCSCISGHPNSKDVKVGMNTPRRPGWCTGDATATAFHSSTYQPVQQPRHQQLPAAVPGSSSAPATVDNPSH